MYLVKASSHRGPVTVACGTADQAIEKAAELASRGFAAILITDPNGKEWTAADLERDL